MYLPNLSRRRSLKNEKEKQKIISSDKLLFLHEIRVHPILFSCYSFPTLGSHVELALPISRNSRIYRGPSSPLYRICLRVG